MKYVVKGSPFPVVEVECTRGEVMLSDSGAMAYMDPVFEMETISKGGLGRLFSGETLFLNQYKAKGDGMIAFGASFPGEIRAIELQKGQSLVVQKSSFLASTSNVSREIVFKKNIMTGVFGGEGFIMNKYTGPGMIFLEIDGAAREFDLKAGQQLILSTGFLVSMDPSCKMDLVSVKGIKNKLLGGEGFFNTVVTGPGHVVVQTMPFSNLAASLQMNVKD